MQETGEKIEFSERRTVTLSRPNGLRVETQQSDGTRTEVTFDGKVITLFDPEDNAMVRLKSRGAWMMPCALWSRACTSGCRWDCCWSARFRRSGRSALMPSSYVSVTRSPPCRRTISWGRPKMWTSRSGSPPPARLCRNGLSVTFWRDEGEPQYRANLVDWSLNPYVSPTQFAFRPPTGAEHIPLLTEARQAVSGPSPTEAPAPTTQNKAVRWVRHPDDQHDIWEYAPTADAFPATATPFVPVVTSAHVTNFPAHRR